MHFQTALVTSYILHEALCDVLNELVIDNHFFFLSFLQLCLLLIKPCTAFPGVFLGVLISAPAHVLIIYSMKPGL